MGSMISTALLDVLRNRPHLATDQAWALLRAEIERRLAAGEDTSGLEALERKRPKNIGSAKR